MPDYQPHSSRQTREFSAPTIRDISVPLDTAHDGRVVLIGVSSRDERLRVQFVKPSWHVPYGTHVSVSAQIDNYPVQSGLNADWTLANHGNAIRIYIP